MNTSKFDDPSKTGAGIWFVIHDMAVTAITDTLKQAYIIYINHLCDNFRCLNCRSHFRNYLDNNPLTNYWNIIENGKDIGFFKWSHEFHNAVNRRLNKLEVEFDEAYKFFSENNGGCLNCGNKNVKVSMDFEDLSKLQEPEVFDLISNYHRGMIKPMALNEI
jgi:hypothetical protein